MADLRRELGGRAEGSMSVRSVVFGSRPRRRIGLDLLAAGNHARHAPVSYHDALDRCPTDFGAGGLRRPRHRARERPARLVSASARDARTSGAPGASARPRAAGRAGPCDVPSSPAPRRRRAADRFRTSRPPCRRWASEPLQQPVRVAAIERPGPAVQAAQPQDVANRRAGRVRCRRVDQRLKHAGHAPRGAGESAHDAASGAAGPPPFVPVAVEHERGPIGGQCTRLDVAPNPRRADRPPASCPPQSAGAAALRA